MLVMYGGKYPEVKGFLAQTLPGILVNNYFTIQEDLDYDKFIAWSINTENWSRSLKENAFMPARLKLEVERIIHQANNFKN